VADEIPVYADGIFDGVDRVPIGTGKVTYDHGGASIVMTFNDTEESQKLWEKLTRGSTDHLSVVIPEEETPEPFNVFMSRESEITGRE